VKVVFEDIKVVCINIEESEEEGDMSSGSDDDEEDGDELDSNIEKDFTTSISSQEKEKPTFIKPFKKRRRMQQMYYPKSRFISIDNNLIFDLTAEEEFRIHNINFRRLTEYTNFVKLMKQKLQSSWEDYKKTIFVSAFSLDKVHLDPALSWRYCQVAIANHTECANIYEEVARLPPQVWDAMKEASVKTWMTYSWSLSWANVDKAFLVEQEIKAGFWNQDIQVIYDSLFPGNPRAIRSLDIEDWDLFCSPWAHDRKDEEKFRYTLSQCGLITGKDPLLSSLYGLLVILTPGAEVESWLREEGTLSLLRRGVRRLLYRYLRSVQGGAREAASTTERLVQMIPELHECMEINYNKRIIGLEAESTTIS